MPGGRPRKDADFFEAKKAEIYDIYVNQNQPLSRVRAHFLAQGFDVSGRLFQARFREWGFPSKRDPMIETPNLHERVKQLWEENHSQGQMLEKLKSEGHKLNGKQLARYRIKNGLFIRHDDNGTKKGDAQNEPTQATQYGAAAPMDDIVPTEVLIARQAKQAKRWADSAQRLKDRSRRRRTKEWHGVPPDTGLPPRFPSELTLQEAKDFLGIGNDKAFYNHVRSIFKEICQAHGVERKAGCEPGVWPAVKEELIDRVPHFQSIFRTPEAAKLDPNHEPIALDIICMDVTKAVRTAQRTMHLFDAKKILHLSPTTSREIRDVFEAILKANYNTSRSDASNEEWDRYKGQWIRSSPHLQAEFHTHVDPDELQLKTRALEIIARDVMKRKRDRDIKRDPNASNKRKRATEPVSNPRVRKAKRGVTAHEETVIQDPSENESSGQSSWIPSYPPPRSYQAPTGHSSGAIDLHQQRNLEALAAAVQIDPDLIRAAQLPSPQRTQIHPSDEQQPTQDVEEALQSHLSGTQLHAAGATQPTAPTEQMTSSPHRPVVPVLPIHIRLAPDSVANHPSLPKIWLDQLSGPHLISNLKATISKKTGSFIVERIEGVVPATGTGSKNGGKESGNTGQGNLSTWDIDEDDELEAYVGYVQDLNNGSASGQAGRKGKGKVTFIVHLS